MYEVPNPNWGPRGNFEKRPVVSNASYIYTGYRYDDDGYVDWYKKKLREVQPLRTLHIILQLQKNYNIHS